MGRLGGASCIRGEHLKDVGGSSAIAGVRGGDQWNRASRPLADDSGWSSDRRRGNIFVDHGTDGTQSNRLKYL